MSEETTLTRRRALAALAAGALPAVAGCSGTDDGTGETSETGATGTRSAAATPGSATTERTTTVETTTRTREPTVEPTTEPATTDEEPRIETRSGVVWRETEEATLKLDAVLLPDQSPAPAAVYVHGGAWRGGRRTVFSRWMEAMARRGYAGLSIEYRLSGEASYPAAPRDVAAGVLWARNNAGDLGIDPDRLALAGSSAGGHLAALVGGAPGIERFHPREGPDDPDLSVAAVGGFSGVYDLTTPRMRSADSVQKFVGESYEDRPELYREASPVEHVDGDDPPVKLLHGDADVIVPYSQATAYRDALRSAGATVDLVTAEDAGHVYFRDDDWIDQSVDTWAAFLDEHL